jgi:hypothetical protein
MRTKTSFGFVKLQATTMGKCPTLGWKAGNLSKILVKKFYMQTKQIYYNRMVPCSSPILQKLTVSQLVRNSTTFMEP